MMFRLHIRAVVFHEIFLLVDVMSGPLVLISNKETLEVVAKIEISHVVVEYKIPSLNWLELIQRNWLNFLMHVTCIS